MNELFQALRLKHVESGLPTLLEQARQTTPTYEAFLRRVLTLEIEGRQRQAQQARLKAARLPVRKTLDEFDFDFQPSLSERHLRELLISA